MQAKLITIKGNVKDITGEKAPVAFFRIELMEEYLTGRRVLLTEAAVDAHGNFESTFSLDETALVFLDFGKVERSLYCVPGKAYFVKVRAPFTALSFNHGFMAKDVLAATITNTYPTELNYMIDSLEKQCSDFLFDPTINRKQRLVVFDFTDSLKVQFTAVKDDFFQTYLNSKISELKMFFYRTRRNVFFENYLVPLKNITSNPMQSRLVYNFFKGNFKNIHLSFKERIVVTAILKKDIEGLKNLLYPENIPINEEIKELIVLIGLYEIRFMEAFNRVHLINFLTEFIAQSKFKKHQLIARNIMYQINHLKPGNPAPKLHVNSLQSYFDLAEDRSEYVYLCFFKSWDESMLNEFKVMNFLQRRFERDLKIICVSTDIDTNNLKQFKQQLHQQKIAVEVYHYGYDVDILIDYRLEDFRIDRSNVEALQKYFLIHPNGEMVLSPAQKPSKGFEYAFKAYLSKL